MCMLQGTGKTMFGLVLDLVDIQLMLDEVIPSLVSFLSNSIPLILSFKVKYFRLWFILFLHIIAVMGIRINSYILQAVWVWTVSLPVTVVNSSDYNPSLQAADIVGWIMWSVGVSVEATADQQKLSFKNSPDNRGKWCNIGLWSYSRHPNYFGEVSAGILFKFMTRCRSILSSSAYNSSQYLTEQ